MRLGPQPPSLASRLLLGGDNAEVRVIGADGQQLGIMTVNEAQALADEKNLDLVEVAAAANPPVCRIMDFHKYRYEQRKKGADSKKKTTSSSLRPS